MRQGCGRRGNYACPIPSLSIFWRLHHPTWRRFDVNSCDSSTKSEPWVRTDGSAPTSPLRGIPMVLEDPQGCYNTIWQSEIFR
jgi:hypothetical protein